MARFFFPHGFGTRAMIVGALLAGYLFQPETPGLLPLLVTVVTYYFVDRKNENGGSNG